MPASWARCLLSGPRNPVSQAQIRVAVLEQEERDEQHEHQAGQDLQEDLAAGQHRARHQRLVLLEVAQHPVGQALRCRACRRWNGGPASHVCSSVPVCAQLVDQGRVVGRGPGHGQRARAGQHGHREQQRAPGGGQGGQPEPAQPGLQRLQQRGEQQRRHARQHHQAQHAGHPEGQVDDDADEQQPPRPARRALQPAGYLRARPGRRPGAALIDALLDGPHPVIWPGRAARRRGRPRCGLAWLSGSRPGDPGGTGTEAVPHASPNHAFM